MNYMRSSIMNSARSSKSLSIDAMTRILNIITGSNGGWPPCDAIRIGKSNHQTGAENLEVDPRLKRLEMIAGVPQLLQTRLDNKKSRLAAP